MRRAAAVAAAIVGVGIWAGTASAALDQEAVENTSGQAINDVAAFQTFTAGISGELNRAELAIASNGCDYEVVTATIYRVGSQGLPVGSPLAQAQVSGEIPGEFLPADYADPAAVVEGRKYALAARASEACDFTWGAHFADDFYTRGEYGAESFGGGWFLYDAGDLAFRTYVRPARCGAPATKVSDDRGEKLGGTRGRDVIALFGGNDRANGKTGNDDICGGDGKDKLKGGPGRDRLVGGPGRDVCIGGPGRDRLLSCEVKR